MIIGIHNLHFYVQDMERAVAFYEAAFNAEVVESEEHWSTLKLFGLTLGLHGNEGKPVLKRANDINGVKGGVTLALRSNDIPADRKRLEQLGAKILDEVNADWGHLLIFEDLDGNVLNLQHPKL